MTEHFFTWGDLVTYGGAVMAVLIITEFTKDLPGIRKIPTRIWAYLVALVLLVPAAVFTADTIRAEDVLLCLVNGVLVAMAAVGSFHSVQEQLK
ncbi:MAG: hypothetical protein IKE11_11295 [Clostridia bacterium]|nr:hypothetical protein [Clostridia bacterium]